jgi:hypothetical protein
MKRIVNKILGRKTEEDLPVWEPKKSGEVKEVRYQGGTLTMSGSSTSGDDWATSPANPASPLSPLNPLNSAFNGASAVEHRHTACDPAPTHHSSHCPPDTTSHHTTTHHDTSSMTSHHTSFDFGGGGGFHHH